MEIPGIIIIVFLVSACNGLDVHLNCTYGSELFPAGRYKGYPTPGDLPLLNRKIIRGRRVSILEHPYIVSIRRQVSHYLTGTLISGNLVLTVAHPLVNVPIIDLGVVLGRNYNDRGDALFTVLLMVVHENFDPATLRADLALLKMYESLDFIHLKMSIKSVRSELDSGFELDSKSSVSAFVTGWGRCDVTGKELCLPRASKYFRDEAADPMLRSINIHITQDSPHCKTYERHDLKILEGMLCVGPARQADHTCPCLGVPGAPLVVSGNLLGVLSWGFGCGYHTDLPLIYTDVRFYNSWISDNVDIISKMNNQKFGQMYEVTRLAIITEWLSSTRNGEAQAEHEQHGDLEIQPWEIDKDLAFLNGDVYDVRDFYGKKDYHQEKMKGYSMIRASQMKELKEKLVRTTKSAPSTSSSSSNLQNESSDSEYELDYLIQDSPYHTISNPNILGRTYTTTTQHPSSDEEYY
ncbi:hypothetical protein O0L34_g2731 [Tuta absoluta]|nr:hypothetical protein O0L34_g2731 [Tuta absoluta]